MFLRGIVKKKGKLLSRVLSVSYLFNITQSPAEIITEDNKMFKKAEGENKTKEKKRDRLCT